MTEESKTGDVARRALAEAHFARETFDGSTHTEVRAAILRDLFATEDTGAFPVRLTQHPYRPGMSVDLQRRFEPTAWRELPKANLTRLAADH